LIELNKKRLIPQKELENYLKNLKNAHKTIYQRSIEDYLATKHALLKSAGITQ
jgi:ribosome biogenesis GTPase A